MAADPHIANVKLLMGFNGLNNSTGSPGMDDESSAAHGTATINNASISTAQSVFGGSSLNITSVGAVVSFPDHADYNLSNGLFTIECRIRPLSVTGGATRMIIGQWGSAPNLGWLFSQLDTTLRFGVSTTGSDSVNVMNGGAMSANTWYAVCAEFDGTKYRLYIDGVMVGSSTTLRTAFNSTAALGIGVLPATSTFVFNGNIDELRFTKSVARYASDAGYTVATSPFPRPGEGNVFNMPAGQGALTPSGQNVTLRYSRDLPAAPGTVTLSGLAVNLIYQEQAGLTAATGVLVMSGHPAVLDVTRILPKPMELKFGRKVYLRRW